MKTSLRNSSSQGYTETLGRMSWEEFDALPRPLRDLLNYAPFPVTLTYSGWGNIEIAFLQKEAEEFFARKAAHDAKEIGRAHV